MKSIQPIYGRGRTRKGKRGAIEATRTYPRWRQCATGGSRDRYIRAVPGRLLVISHTPHHRDRGRIVGWGPTVRELSHLAGRLEELVHVAPVHPGVPSATDEAYADPRVRIRPVRPAGGAGFRAKAGVLGAVAGWTRAILDEMARADAVHVRCPAAIGLVGLVVTYLRAGDRPVWVKYAGSWHPPRGTPVASRLQRAWLARETRGWVVTVNPGWEDLPPHVRQIPNPCLRESELGPPEGRALAPPLRLLFVGRVEREKGADRALDVLEEARGRGLDVRLDVAGDGSLREPLERAAAEKGLTDRTAFHGWRTRAELFELYRQAHFLVLPSRSEGWPKAIAEGMAHGVVPLASRLGSIPHYLERDAVGRAIALDAVAAYADALEAYTARPERWREESARAVRAAREFTYEAHVERVIGLIAPPRDTPPPAT